MAKSVKILHLFSKALDLYGDGANLTAISSALSKMGISSCIDYCELWDKMPSLSDYDIVYIGHGKAKNLLPCLQKLMNSKTELFDYINSNKVFLCVGNSRELFGKSFKAPTGETIEGLGLFSYTADETGEVIVSDEIGNIETTFGNITTYGFINRTAHIENTSELTPLFTLTKGIGDGTADTTHEGNRYKNFFGTWQIGPILVRNPLLLKSLLKLILAEDYRDFDTTLEQKALDTTLAEFSGEPPRA